MTRQGKAAACLSLLLYPLLLLLRGRWRPQRRWLRRQAAVEGGQHDQACAAGLGRLGCHLAGGRWRQQLLSSHQQVSQKTLFF